ncbi:2-hydroxyhepta-2,4-diene-1,7-dioate isomerase [Emticicia sp. CRIBPO]|uniref:fumarylacetoacetate hydrolase family protein n=1 Tax=Emticicia sp. CRIBPO TaxID=2683258 RepID=UPI001411D500|nr:fumarylacetoacetate hydrolase family protein [Emticicia sp. CRIBPO]NBA87193.1 2-hydroxyhepta-2,4-diene-1,7-dioate isomerase [Emticicia sp. CRIBPO]
MRIYKTTKGIIIEDQNQYFVSSHTDWDAFINRPDLHQLLKEEILSSKANGSLSDGLPGSILAPIQSQEIWASGVTYLRSKNARMEESKDAGGGDFYDRVYDAPRPELFFKATPYRTVGHLQAIRLRKDSHWNVPEPELTLFINSDGQISGYTVGNDVSSRDIEGENPLYLPQAKSYDKSAAIGPCIYVPETPISPETVINLVIERAGEPVFDQSIQINQMKRQHKELVEYLYKECSFPFGCFLMTGTGIVPPDSFTLQSKDVVKITIENIGTLENIVE